MRTVWRTQSLWASTQWPFDVLFARLFQALQATRLLVGYCQFVTVYRESPVLARLFQALQATRLMAMALAMAQMLVPHSGH